MEEIIKNFLNTLPQEYKKGTEYEKLINIINYQDIPFDTKGTNYIKESREVLYNIFSTLNHAKIDQYFKNHGSSFHSTYIYIISIKIKEKIKFNYMNITNEKLREEITLLNIKIKLPEKENYKFNREEETRKTRSLNYLSTARTILLNIFVTYDKEDITSLFNETYSFFFTYKDIINGRINVSTKVRERKCDEPFPLIGDKLDDLIEELKDLGIKYKHTTYFDNEFKKDRKEEKFEGKYKFWDEDKSPHSYSTDPKIKQALIYFDLKEGFTKIDLKSIYYKKCLETHPDKGGSKEEFQDLQKYYDILKILC